MSRNSLTSQNLAGPVLPGAESQEEDRRGSQGESATPRTPSSPAVHSDSLTKNDREWWEAEAAMHKDRAQRLEVEVAKLQEQRWDFENLATVLAEIALRAGVKPKTDKERAALAWAEQYPNVRKPKPVQAELAA